ncbi:uncharacterized protein LOC100199505 isoform X2 [Hydra vulgaris]|uniref:Uncharacterized protein LOC100199505 isoform X2 n=1 Tax=Hydra vulgaris TaxID=6087 RepID=A0ABM4DGZ3_HYDVU
MKLGLLIFFAANTLAAPFWVLDKDLPRAEVKDVGCKASRLRQGLDYTYDYEGETMNKIDGASTQATGLKLRAQITITPIDECKFYMKISKTELLQKSMSQDSFVKSTDSENFKIALEKYDLVFSISENQITKLFSNKDEPVYILNTKRGILSTIQLEESVSVESDVNGLCKTTITQEDGKVVKSKKLSDCSQRTIQEIGFHAATIKSESDLKVLDSNSKCVYKMSGNIINSVSCEETHLFKPFSAGHKAPSGAVTTVKQTLSNLQESKASSITSKIIDGKMQESSILYDHTSEENQAIKSLKDEFEETIQRLAKPNEVKQFTVKMDSAHEFSTMVFLLRKMDMKRMTIVWDKYFDCIESKLCDSSQVDLRDVYRQYLLDGIAYCGTSTCVTMVHDAIVKEAITGERMNIFLQSIALVATTSRKIIRDLMGIVSKQPTRQGYLTLGTILYRHCKKNIADCDDIKPNIITQAENFLIGKLGKNCEGQENYERVEEILMSLKALSNAQRPSRASSVILSCAANSEHVNITTAAFDAIGNMPCDKVIVDELYNFVKETSNAPNKRISAFVALMKCPNEILLEHVVDLLEQEPSNQLASFIWSYLTNIMESSNPKHESTKALLEKITKIKPLREFNMPFHQYSKAFEKSTYFQSIKSGAAIETHVIFNHENYFPQSAFFDLTANVLGVPVSLLETNIGIEGMEDLLEQAAGNDGFLSKNNFVFSLFNFNITAEKLRDLAQQREPSVVRNRRATGANEDSITELHKKVNRKNKLPNGHLSFKVMGQEIRTFSYDDIFYMVDQIDNMNVVQLLLNVAKGGSKTFTKSMMFLEMTQTVPTGLGLPLKLKLVGTTVAGIELNGKFDIRNMFWGPGSLTINGFVKPSAAVEISGQMGVDGHFVSSGVFVNSSMFVSNTIKGAIVYQEGKLLKINMDVPEEPVELFKIGSTPFMYLNGKNEAVEGVERKVNPEETCFKSVMIGYGVCTSIRMPVSFREYEAPYFPLSGPAHFGVKLFRADEKLQTFQFLVSMTKKQPVTSGVIEFSTPGAFYERKLGGEFLFSDVDDIKTLTLSAKKSNKMASVEFSYNSVTHQTSVVGKNNFFTEKDIVTKFVFFNTSNTVNVNQIGLRFSTEYDWYKFESVTKLVKKETGFILTGSTLYYPTKSITGVLEYNSDEQKIITRVEVAEKSFELTGNYQKKGNERGFTVVASSGNVMSTFYGGFLNEANKQEVLLSVNGFGGILKNTYTYENVNGQRSFETKLLVNDHAAQLRSEFKFEGDASELVFTADIFGKTAVSKFLVVNTASIKEVNVTANIVGNSGQASLKYLADSPSLVSSFDVMGSKLNAFVTLDNSIGYKIIVGGSAGGYTAGVRNVYSQTEDTQSLCATLYYETKNLEKQAGIGCAKITLLNKEFIQSVIALTFTAGEGKKNVEFVIDFEKHTSLVKLNTDFKFNNNLLFNNRVTIKYNKLIDSEASVSYKVLNYDTGFKLFSRKSNEELHFGFETRVMKTSVLFLQRYSTVAENKEMKSEIFVNDKIIPVNAQMNYIKNALEKKIVLRLTGGQYSIENYYSIFNKVNIFQFGSGVTVNKGESTIFNVYDAAAIQLNDKSKAFYYKFGAVLFEKTYEYGWETEYKNLGTSDKTSFSLVSGIQYAINRKSSISLTISNSKSDASAVVEFEYIPSNILIYSINLNKVLYQVDASFEFLPKMFTKFMARLEDQNGYQLITDGNVEWSGYKRSLGATYTYKHTNSELIVSSSIGKNFSFSFTHLKNSPKLIELTIGAFENNAKWISIFQNSHLQNQFIWNDKEIINIGTNMELDAKSFFFQISKGKEALMKLSKSFNNIGKKVTLNLPDVRNLISFDGKLEKDALSFKVFGKEEWISLNVEVNREKNTALAIISVFNRTLKVTGLFPTDRVSLFVNPYFMNEFSLNAIYNPQERSINLNAKTISRTVGVILRCDIQNKIASFQTFCNENKISLNVFVEKNSFISQFSIAPKFTFQFVFDILNDDTLIFSTQTLNEGKPLTLTSVKYQLSKGFSQLALNWNQETASMIYQTVSPIIETFSDKSIQNSKMFVNYIYESAMSGKISAMEFIDMMDKAYSEVDIKLSQEKLKSLAVSSIQQLSEILKHALKEIVRSIDSLKKQLPEVFQKLTNLKDQINIILRKVSESVVEINSDLEKNWKEAVIIVFEAISNITKSSQPVVVKAFELIREFKVQGVTVEEFILSQSKGIQYLTDYARSASNNLTVLVSKLKEEYFVNRENILLFKVPYTNETMEKVLAIIVEKGLELKNLIVQLTLKVKNQIHDLNLQTYFEEMQIKLMNFKIENKSIEEHIAILKKNSHVNIQLILNDMQRVIQKIQLKTQLYVNKVMRFLTPLMDHIKFVNAAVIKHFEPFLTKSANKVLQKVSVIHIPDIEKFLREKWVMIEKILLPMLEPIQPFYIAIRKQITNFEVNNLESWLNMQKLRFEDYAKEMFVKARMNIDDQINVLNSALEKVSKATQEEIVRNIGLSDLKKKEVVEFFVKKITEHEKLFSDILQKVKLLWNQLKSQCTELTSKSLKDVIDSLFINSSANQIKSNILSTAEELSKALKKLSEMDLTESILKNASSSVQMSKLQMDSMIEEIVKQSKMVNTTEITLKTIQMVQQLVADIYASALVITTNLYSNMDPYLSKMADLEYKQLFTELKTYALNYSKEIHSFGNQIYNISKETIYTDRLSNVYATNKVHLEMLYAHLSKIEAYQVSKIDYNQVYDEYVVPLKHWCTELCREVKEKSELVYGDVEEPSKKLFIYYKSIVTGFVAENYNAVVDQASEFYKTIISELNVAWNKIEVQLKELSAKLYATYQHFLTQYEDMTWEEIIQVVCAHGRTIAKETQMNTIKLYNNLLKLSNVWKDEIEKMYMMKATHLNLYLTNIQSKVQPEVIRMVFKYKIFVGKRIADIKRIINEITKFIQNQASNIKDQVVVVYNANKNKSLKKIYSEVTAITVTEFNKQYESFEKNVNDLKNTVIQALQNFSHNYYTKANVLLQTVIIPELVAESESFINQTLRLSVILANETVNAYSPHFYLITDIFSKFTEEMKTKVLDLSEEVSKRNSIVLEENLTKLQNILNNFSTKLQNNNIVVQTINHEYVKQSSIEFKKLKETIELKMNELKLNPTSKEYKLQTEEALNKIQEYFKEFNKYFSEQFNINEIIALMQNVRESGMFTLNKATQKLKPGYSDIVAETLATVERVFGEMKNVATLFRQYPEETFWKTLSVAKGNIRSIISIDLLEINTRYSRWLLEIREDDYFNEWTKTSIKKAVKYAQSTSESLEMKVKDLISYTKTTISFYQENIKQIKNWYNNQMSLLPEKWSKCPISSIFANPLWNNLKNELTNHELFVVAHIIAGKGQEKFVDIKDMALAELNNKNNELNTQLFDRYHQTKERKLNQYKELAEKYNHLIKKVDERYQELVLQTLKTLDDTTLSDVVSFIQTSTNQIVENLFEVKKMFDDVQLICITKGIALYNKYSNDFIAQFENYKLNVITIFDHYQIKVTNLGTQLHTELYVLFVQYKQTLVPYYARLEATVQQYYHEFYPVVVGKYNDVYLKVKSQLDGITLKSKLVFNEFIKNTIDMTTLAYSESYSQWMQSDLRVTLVSLRKMTIKETVSALLRLPSQIKKVIITSYNKYQKNILELSEKVPKDLFLKVSQLDFSQLYNSYYNTCHHFCSIMYKSMNENYNLVYKNMITAKNHYQSMYKEVLVQLEGNKNDLVKLVKPFVVSSLSTITWVKNEITESTLFFYQYYHVDEKFKTYRDLLFSEYKNIIPTFNEYKEVILKVSKEYTDVALKITQEYKEKVLIYTKEHREQAKIVFQKYKEIVIKYIHKYHPVAEKFMGQYIEHTQHYVKECQAIAFKYYEKIKEQVPLIALKYRDMAQQYKKEYQATALMYYEEIKEHVPVIALKYKDKAQQYAKEYQVIALKYYEEIKEQAPKIALKCKDMAQQYAKEYQVIALKYYEEFKEQAPKIALKYRDMAQQYAKEYQVIALKYYEEFKEQAPKIALKYRDMAQQYAKEYQVIALKYYEEFKEQAPKIALKYRDMAQQYAKEYQIIALKYYEEFKEQAPTIALKYRDMAQQYAKEYQVIALKYYEEFKEQAPKIALKYRDMAQQYAKEYQAVVEKFTGEYKELIQKEAAEYKILVQKYYEEFAEQAPKVIVKYRALANRYIQEYQDIAEKLVVEYKEQMQKVVFPYKEMIVKFVKEYHPIVEKLIADYKNITVELARKYILIAQKIIDESRKYITNFNLKNVKNDLDSVLSVYMTELGKYVSIESKYGEMHINVYHSEITPKFSHHLSSIGVRSRRNIDSVKMKGSDLILTIEKQFEELKAKVQQLITKIQYFLTNSTEVKATLLASYYKNRKILETGIENGMQQLNVVYKNALNEFETIKIEANKVINNFSVAYYFEKSKEISSRYYSHAQTQSLEYYKQAKEFYSKYLGVAQKLLSEYFIIVEKYYSNYYTQVQEISMKYYNQAQKLYPEYYNQAKELFLKYHSKAQEFSLKFYNQGENLYSQYYSQAKEFSIKYYNQAEKLYPEYYNQVKELYLKYYSQAQMFSLKHYRQAQNLYSEYYNQAKEFSLKYYNQIEKLYPEYFNQARELSMKYYGQAQKLYSEYYNQANEFSIKYYNQAAKSYPEYYNQARDFSLKYYEQAQKLYSEYYNQAKELSLKYYNQAVKSYPEYHNQVSKFLMKYYNPAQKLYIEYHNQMKQLSLKYLTQVQDFSFLYINQAEKLYLEYYNQAKELSLKYYNQAEKLSPEYYDHAKQLSLKYYTQAQEFSLNYFNQTEKLYSEYYNQAQEFSLKYYNLAQKLYPEYYSKAKEFCLEYYNQSQKIYIEYQSQTKILYSDYYNRVQKLTSMNYDQINKFSLEYFKQAQDLSLKYYNQILSITVKCKNNVQEFYNKNINEAETLYLDYYNQVQSLSLEYLNLTEKFYSESQKLSVENYEQALVIYSNYKKQVEMLYTELYKRAHMWSVTFYEKSNVELKKLYIIGNTLFSEFKKDPSAFMKSVYQKSIELFNFWSSKAENLYDQYQPKIVVMLKDHQTLLLAKANKLSKQITLIYNKLESKLNNWKSKVTPENIYVVFETVQQSLKETPIFLRARALKMYQLYQPKIASIFNQQKSLLTTNFVNLLKQIKITYNEFETAFNNWKSGVSAEKAFYQITRKFKLLTKYASYETLENIRQALCINHLEACQRFTESIQMQVTFIKSYVNNIFKVVVSKEVALLQYVRNEFSFINDQKKSLISSLATAIIFGNNHVITFDRKVYDFIDYNQRDCTYLLARDFVHGKFSIMRQSDTTIINTPDMSIKIKNDGKTQATIGNKTINSLPVESESSKCVRLYDVIRCEFIEQGIFVSVDLINFVTTIQLSSWHFGKTQGVLGTYNHESYDDWKMPDGKIADNIYKFANAYEVSKKRSCVATPKEKACSNAPSAKCKELFNSTSSMFARFFKIADPKPFLKACEDDTSCKSVGHCSSVTAYRVLLKALGEKPDFCPDCVAFDSHKINEEWNLKPTGSVDVVMLVSDRVSGKDFKKQLMKIMIQVQQFLRVNKYDTRYALIGFGGKGVHESSHIRPIGTGDIFGSSDDLLKEMKKMEFNGEDSSFNDAFEAITMASKLSFRPGASRIFILYTEDDVKSSLSGVTQIEAQHFLEKEANASLVVFQNLQTKMLAQQLKGNFIAETAHRVYSDKAPTGSQKGSQSLTNSTFKKLTDSSNGALFTTDFTSVNIVSKSLYDVMSLNIQRVNSQCQKCVVQAKPNGDPVVKCATRNDITC